MRTKPVKIVFMTIIYSFLHFKTLANIKKTDLENLRKHAWKNIEAKCSVMCDKGFSIYDRQRVTDLRLPKSPIKKYESNVNCFDPKLVCVDSFSYCGESKVAQVTWVKDLNKKSENIKLKGQCSTNKKYGLVFQSKLPVPLLSGVGSFRVDKVYYSGSEFYSKDIFYYKAVTGE